MMGYLNSCLICGVILLSILSCENRKIVENQQEMTSEQCTRVKGRVDFNKGKKRAKGVKPDSQPAKIPTSIRLDGSILAWYKTEADRQGVPYQTLISSILHRYATSELVDKTEVKRIQKAKGTG